MKRRQFLTRLGIGGGVVVLGGVFAWDYFAHVGSAEGVLKPTANDLLYLQPGWLPPNFSLPDAQGKQHSLKELSGGQRTHLMSLCGCARCQTYLSFISKLRRQPGVPQLNEVAILTAPRDMEESLRHNTGYRGKIVYDRPGGPVVNYWQGSPCPRAYILDDSGRLEWLSPANQPDMPRIGLQYAGAIGVTQKPTLIKVMQDLAVERGDTENLPPSDKLAALIDFIQGGGPPPINGMGSSPSPPGFEDH